MCILAQKSKHVLSNINFLSNEIEFYFLNEINNNKINNYIDDKDLKLNIKPKPNPFYIKYYNNSFMNKILQCKSISDLNNIRIE